VNEAQRLFDPPEWTGENGRRCRDCGETKPASSFKTHSQSPNYPYPSCNECDQKHAQIIRGTSYMALVSIRGEVCWICGKPGDGDRRLHIDVDRRTWSVRGLLCFNHNSGLGKFSEDALLTVRASDYLLSWERDHK
jgi:hypothetical protein